MPAGANYIGPDREIIPLMPEKTSYSVVGSPPKVLDPGKVLFHGDVFSINPGQTCVIINQTTSCLNGTVVRVPTDCRNGIFKDGKIKCDDGHLAVRLPEKTEDVIRFFSDLSDKGHLTPLIIIVGLLLTEGIIFFKGHPRTLLKVTKQFDESDIANIKDNSGVDGPPRFDHLNNLTFLSFLPSIIGETLSFIYEDSEPSVDKYSVFQLSSMVSAILPLIGIIVQWFSFKDIQEVDVNKFNDFLRQTKNVPNNLAEPNSILRNVEKVQELKETLEEKFAQQIFKYTDKEVSDGSSYTYIKVNDPR